MSTPQPYWPAPPPARRRFTPVRIALISALALTLLCCGGLWTLGTLAGPAETPGKQAQQPLLAAPTTAEPPPAAVPRPASPVPAGSSSARPGTPAVTAEPVPHPTRTTPRPARTTPRPARTTPKPRRTTPKPAPTTRKPTPKQTRTTTQPAVHPGAFCAPEGARGRTSKGTAMRCTLKAGEDRARWRRA